MAEKLTLRSQSPYYDDFEATKNFLQVLYRPSFPVQARELTTSQSFMMEQVKRFADFVFKDGSRVSGANLTVNSEIYNLTVTGSTSTVYPSASATSGSTLGTLVDFDGLVISNASGTVKAQVVSGLNTGTSTTGNIYIKYITSETFSETGGYIYAKTTDNASLSQTLYTTFESLTNAVLANIEAGIYYTKGVFTNVNQQSIILSETSSSVDCIIGLIAQEKIVDQTQDTTLFDNARGTTNEGAPGAHRLTLDLTLATAPIGSQVDTNFYQVAAIENSQIQSKVEISEGVNTLMDILAERTYDESGDYTVTTPKPVIATGDSESVFNVKVNPFKAYVRGYKSNFTSPFDVEITKSLENQSTTRNYSVPVDGLSYFYIWNHTGTLPGSTGGDVFSSVNRLLIKDDEGKNIGICRGYAVNDEFEKGEMVTKLYVYDLKMFQILQLDAAYSFTEGNDFYSGKTRGYVYTEDSDHGVSNGICVINANSDFSNASSFASDAAGVSGTIEVVFPYNLSQAAQVTSTDGTSFVADIDFQGINNPSPSLVYNLDKKIKTMKDGSATIMDNNFTIIQNTGATATTMNTANGYWDSSDVNDQEENTKTLNFAYLKIKNDSSRSGANYGWLATDKEISLLYSDVFKVYGINKSSDATFENGSFMRLDVATTGIIPQGVILTGETSGAECIVALSNSVNQYQTTQSNTSDFHETIVGTGSSSTIEVIKLNGKSFVEGETLSARPIEETNRTYSSTTVDYEDAVYPYVIVFNEISSTAVGENMNNLFTYDTGQRNEFYDVGRLVRKDNTTLSTTGDLIVFYSYFTAQSTANKHYYSADSYSVIDYFDYDIRFNNAPLAIQTKEHMIGVDLRDSLDFRLRNETVITDITKSPFIFNNRNFASQSKILPDSKFTTDLTEFLGKYVSVYLDPYGNIKKKTGKPAANPVVAPEDTGAMKLFDVYVPAAVRYPEKEVSINIIDNKRYTMRDIGKIESRINRLEEGIALSMLESQALHDDVGGRTKMGFVVDDFSTTTNFTSTPADFNHSEFKSSFNVLSKELSAAQTAGVMIDTKITSKTNTSSFFPNFIIKDFDEEEMISQPNATNGHKINPFAVWTFKGLVELSPSFDTWVTQENNYYTNNNGIITEFTGDSDNWEDFLQITSSSPGGISTTMTNWTGWQVDSVERTRDVSVSGRRRRTTTTTTTTTEVNAGVSTTITSFEQPRAIDGTLPITTLSGSSVIPNPQDYFMRPMTISFSGNGFMPDTSHTAMFGNVVVASGVTSDANGTLSGSFNIAPLTHRAGSETITIYDDISGTASYGSTNFTSTGVLESFDVVQDVISSITTSTDVTDTRTSSISRTRTSRVQDNDWSDPIAQLFMLPIDLNGERKTSIISSIDIWFSVVDTRPAMNSVIIEIRETVNGYPGGPETILGTTGSVTVTSSNEVLIPTSSNSTNFKFKQPVKLESDREYAVVIKSPSNFTEVFVATIGQSKLDGSGIHSSQPNVGGYYGSFFVSQNSSSWSAEQNIDLAFKLNRANFTTEDAVVTYSNIITDKGIFNGNIGDYYQSTAIETFENSNFVKVYHPNHGLNFKGAIATLDRIDTATYNGIPSSELIGDHAVQFPTLDTYFIQVTSKATQNGFINTPSLFSKQSIIYDGMVMNLFAVQDVDDNVSIEYKGANTGSIQMVAASDKVSYTDTVSVTKDASFTEVRSGELVTFTDPKIVRNASNAVGNDLTLKLTLQSDNTYSSPFFREDVMHAPIVYRNLTGYFLDEGDLDSLTVTSVTDSDTTDTNKKLASYHAAVSAITENNCYVTKQIDLEVPADGLTLFLDAAMYPDTEVQFFYKARVTGDEATFESLKWESFGSDQDINETNYSVFGTQTNFKNYEVRWSSISEFQSFKVKIVMKTKNEALPPKIKNLRIIADI